MTEQLTLTTPGSRTPQLRIHQQNVNKSLVAQSDLLHRLNPKLYDICTIQEPFLDHNHNSHATPHWFTIYPKEHYISPKKTCSLILVNRCIATDTWIQVDFGSSDITAIQVRTEAGTILMINTYSDLTGQEGIKQAALMLKGSAHATC